MDSTFSKAILCTRQHDAFLRANWHDRWNVYIIDSMIIPLLHTERQGKICPSKNAPSRYSTFLYLASKPNKNNSGYAHHVYMYINAIPNHNTVMLKGAD